MKPVQSLLLEIIERKRTVTVADLSRGAGISKPAVLHHLKKLIENGQVETAPSPVEKPTRGRPVKHYRLAVKQRPTHYCALAEALLLVNLENEPDAEEPGGLVQNLIPHLAVSTDNLAELPFINRMSTVIEHLEEMSYQPHWEVHAGGVRMYLRNCPYAGLSVKYPLLCEMDRALLEYMLGLPVKQEWVWRETPQLLQECAFFFTR